MGRSSRTTGGATTRAKIMEGNSVSTKAKTAKRKLDLSESGQQLPLAIEKTKTRRVEKPKQEFKSGEIAIERW